MNKTTAIFLIIGIVFAQRAGYSFDEVVTIPAESKEGVVVNLETGKYRAELAGGAITLFYPINPDYSWLAGIALGVDVDGGQDEPTLGTLYYEPDKKVYNQAEAENKMLKAVSEGREGTFLEFSLEHAAEVRFWVSDFDYTDNSGMLKVKLQRKEVTDAE